MSTPLLLAVGESTLENSRVFCRYQISTHESDQISGRIVIDLHIPHRTMHRSAWTGHS